MFNREHDAHNVSIHEHCISYFQRKQVKSKMLSPIELSGRELGMIKLMTDFFAEKPELTAKIESYTTAH